MTTVYDMDDYGCIINGPGTYATAARDLWRHPVVLNWTNDRSTLYNILLALNPVRFGQPGGLIDASPEKLWVGIAGRGCFGFNPSGYCAPPYAAEKLGIPLVDAEGVAELITGIRGKLLTARVR